MTMLPDIDEATYTDWAQDEFKRKQQERQGAFNFMQGAQEKMAGLQQLAGAAQQTLGGAAAATGEAIGGAASAVGGLADQQRQQLDDIIARRPSAPSPAAAAPEPAPAAQPAQAAPNFGQLDEIMARGGQAIQEAPAAVGRSLQDMTSQLDQFIGQARPTLQQANEPPLAATQRGGDLHAYARQAAQRQGIDPDVFERQIQQESGFNPSARSPAGATGVAQIMPGYHPTVDPTDPYASLDYAAGLMKSNLGKY